MNKTNIKVLKNAITQLLSHKKEIRPFFSNFKNYNFRHLKNKTVLVTSTFQIEAQGLTLNHFRNKTVEDFYADWGGQINKIN